ncbi:MAG: hypothetical protein KDJ97_35180 [Anaerolineae bacterium]|nr:hypothetical protein [Anaerolineae bacterium]
MSNQDFNPSAPTGQQIALQFRVTYLESMTSHFQAKLDEARQQLDQATGESIQVEPETEAAEIPQGIEPDEQPEIPPGIIKPISDRVGQIRLPVRALSTLTNELRRRMSNPAVNGGQR